MDFLKMIKDPNIKKKYTKLAFSSIVKDLYDKNLYGWERAKDFDFFEDEKVFNQIGHFIPGCFYIFCHDSEELHSKEGKEFHDVLPIFLSLNVGKELEGGEPYAFGINFNILTVPVRAAILQELYNMDKQFFDSLVIKHWVGKHPISKKIMVALMKDNGANFCNYICNKYKIDKKSIAFRRYYFENVTKCRLIDFWQWKYLPFLTVPKGIRGINIAQLQKEAINP